MAARAERIEREGINNVRHVVPEPPDIDSFVLSVVQGVALLGVLASGYGDDDKDCAAF